LNAPAVLYTLISVMVLLWSANFIIGKVALHEFPPVLLGGLRIAIAGLFLAPIYWLRTRTSVDRFLPRKDLGLLALLAVCNVGNQLLFLLGLDRTSVAHSAIVIGLSPMFVLLIAVLAGMERLTARKIAGMSVALAGVWFLTHVAVSGHAAGANASGPTLAGDLITALAALLFAVFAVFGKNATHRHGTVVVNGFAYMAGAMLLSPLIWWQSRTFAYSQVTAAGWSSLAYMAIFPSAICYLIYYYALKHIAASRLAAFVYLEPVIATLMAVAFLGERITASLITSGTVIFAGVYLTERG